MSRFFIILLAVLLSSCRPIGPDIFEKEPESKDARRPVVFDVITIRSSPKLETFWESEMPDFIFCRSSGISKSRAYQGVAYWRNLGYPIENVRYVDDAPECHLEETPGTVVIRLIDNTLPIGNHLAITKVFFYKDTKKIIRSNIYLIRSYANRPRLIEHEIGHALGWRHYNRYLHVMNSEYDNTGHDSTGVNYRKYQELILNFF